MPTVVKRTVGFVRDFAYVGEVAVGTLTVREYGHTPGGAAQRAELAARDRAVFQAARRVTGFVKETVFRTDNHPAPFRVGFA